MKKHPVFSNDWWWSDIISDRNAFLPLCDLWSSHLKSIKTSFTAFMNLSLGVWKEIQLQFKFHLSDMGFHQSVIWRVLTRASDSTEKGKKRPCLSAKPCLFWQTAPVFSQHYLLVSSAMIRQSPLTSWIEFCYCQWVAEVVCADLCLLWEGFQVLAFQVVFFQLFVKSLTH